MRHGIRSTHRRRGATIILLMLMLPLALLPLVGLGIDATRIYIVQSKLQCAVDGAALGAGRLLGTNANTTEIAGEFLKVNFPTGYWGTSSVQSNITYANNLGSQKITVQASVNLPLTFIRLVGIPQSAITANAVATRAVTRVVIVLDRSNSMHNNDPVTGKDVFTTMKQGAEWFAAQFTPNYDELGLVVFSGSGLVAYPMGRPYDPSPTGTGGPNKTFATDPEHQVGPIFDQLQAMAYGGGTNMSEALSLAYIEMQKAHNHDLATYGVDNTLNTIVLFTDGVPSTVTTYANDPLHNSLKTFGTGTGQSRCTNNPAVATTASTQMRGWIGAPGNPPSPGHPFPAWAPSIGLYRLSAYDTNNTLAWWMGTNGAKDQTNTGISSSIAGCRYLGGSYGETLDDLAKVPDFDLYGNPTTGLGYTNSVITNGTQTWNPNTGAYNPNISPTRGYDIAASCWNATDAIGNTIRSQNFMNQIQIFTIGYTGNNPGTDIGLLRRLANVPPTAQGGGSSSFVATQPIGKFYQVNDANQLSAAFDAVASSLLRLAQ